MKKTTTDKRRVTAANSDPVRQVITRTSEGLTAVNGITIRLSCEPRKAPAVLVANDIENAWENWAATHHDSAL